MKRKFTSFFLLVCLVFAQKLQAANANVNVADFAFSPAQVTINQGESVTWHWVSGTHPTQSDSNPAAWATFTLGPGNTTFTQTFNAPGSYPYHCLVHGAAMSGVITVLGNPSGMKENHGKDRLLEVYPNPAKDILKVAITNPVRGAYELKITNAIGKTVKAVSKEELELKAGSGIAIDVSEMPAGLYFVTLWNKEGILETRRQVIVH